MKEKKWNPKDWQGRRQHQVETGYKIMGLSIITVSAVGVIYGLCSLVSYVLG